MGFESDSELQYSTGTYKTLEVDPGRPGGGRQGCPSEPINAVSNQMNLFSFDSLPPGSSLLLTSAPIPRWWSQKEASRALDLVNYYHFSIWLNTVHAPCLKFNFGRVFVTILSSLRYVFSELSHTLLHLTPLPALAPQTAAAPSLTTEVAGL